MQKGQSNKFGLVVLSAPSGAGKSTLSLRLLANSRLNFKLSISTTTRAPRGQEQNGKEYFFVTRESFEQLISNQAFAEWARVHDQYYGTKRETIEQSWAQGKHVLLDIDVQGAESIKRIYGDRALLIFVAPPSLEELERRLRGRGTESEASVQKRMANAVHEMAHQKSFDHVIVNVDLDQAERLMTEMIETFFHQLQNTQTQGEA